MLTNILWLIITFVSVFLGVCLVMGNPELVSFKILGFESSIYPQGLLMLGSFSIGCVLTLLVTSSTLIKLKYRLNKAKKQLAKLESSIKIKKD